MADKVFLAKTDAAANSDEFIVRPGDSYTFYLYPAASLTAAEYVNLQRKDPEGTWQTVFDHSFKGSGGQVRLDTTVTEITVIGEGVYRWDKDDPTSAIGIGLADQANA